MARSKGLRHVHPTAYVHPSARVTRDIRVAQFGYVGPESWLTAGVELAPFALLAPRVAVVGSDHNYDSKGTPIEFSERPLLAGTFIGRDVWVGYGSVLLTGIRIGEGAIVAASSTVTKDVPAYEIWAGNPARRIKERFKPDEAEQHSRALDLALNRRNWSQAARKSGLQTPPIT